MNEKALTVLDNFEFEVNSTYRFKGNYGFVTGNDKYILQEYKDSNEKMESISAFCIYLEKEGLLVDKVVPNKDGAFVNIASDGESYILKKWYDMEECKARNKEQLLSGALGLAQFHSVSDGIENEIKLHPGVKLSDAYQRRTEEMIRIRNYVRKRKNKKNFELTLSKIIEKYLEQAKNSYEELKNIDYEVIYENAIKDKSISHGSYNYHNFGFVGEQIVYTNLCRLNYGPKVVDLYGYLRKCLEKNNWDKEFGMQMIAEYEKVRQLEDYEKKLMKIMFSYPEKFWKIVNYYYNSNKAWYSEKNEEKLASFLKLENNRWEFINSLYE